MNIKLKVLCENSAGGNGTLGEWGWSVLIEVDDKTILLDTGAGNTIIHNANLMNIDLRKVETMVLSHSHFDHTGGIREALRSIGKTEIDIIAHPDIWAKKYNQVRGQDVFMGMPFQREELESFGARFVMTRDAHPVCEKVITSGEVPMGTSFETASTPAFSTGNAKRYILTENGHETDQILDDLSVIIRSPLGLIVILGCAHRGVVNTLIHARNITGIDDIYAVFGGAHLVTESADRIDKTIQAFKEMDIQILGLCHCTGQKAIARMITELGNHFMPINAGSIVKIDSTDSEPKTN